jgi:phospholipid/cholesterol/gamma-HCH transport system substrate-binding protein
MQALRPTARELGPALRATRPFLRQSTPIIQNQLRPFAREARPAVKELRTMATALKPVTPRLTRTFEVINSLLNTLAYNPPGNEEGYLFWTAWANHAAASIFSTQDAHGPIRRGIVIASCDSLALLENVTATNPQLAVLYELLHAPPSKNVCPSTIPPGVPEQGTPGTPSKTQGLGVEATSKKPSRTGGADGGKPVAQSGKPAADAAGGARR